MVLESEVVEYERTLKRGETPKTSSKKNGQKHKAEARRSQNATSMECQPTSSKVKVEDLVSDDHHGWMEDKASSTGTKRSVWDRPVPHPNFEWAFDPRMPAEWNELVASMYAWSGPRWNSLEGVYRQASDDEVSQPSEIIFDGVSVSSRRSKDKFAWPTGQAMTPEQPRKAERHKGKGKSEGFTVEDIPNLRRQWQEEFADILNGTKEELPPWRDVNHEINLIDEHKVYKYHLPRCPMALQQQLRDKTNRYLRAQWWEARPASQAAPLLCIPKKDGTLRTALDARQRNDNTVKDVTPLPDQEVIREDVARAKFRSKIDLTDAYEQ
ncbi:hypothetical protein C0992_011603, partial [Termitomyces sp. T32_za158]